MSDFDTFWQAYPRKIGKGDARAKFVSALHLTDLPTMLAALEQYKLNKPATQQYCHPATWLHQQRWDDEWTEPGRVQTPMRPVQIDEYRQWLRESNSKFWNADPLPNYLDKTGRYEVPQDWVLKPNIRVVK